MQHLPQIEAARHGQSYDYSECFSPVAELLSQADLTIVNLETTLRPTPPYSGYPTFSAPNELAQTLANVGVDVALLANNHICDKGYRGIERTISALDSANIRHTGAYISQSDFEKNNPLRLNIGGFDFAILNYTYGTNGLPIPQNTFVNLIDTSRIATDLRQAQDADIRLVCIHWGEEYLQRPTKQQRQLAEWLYNKGATAIIGGHPHVIQPIEVRTNENGAIEGVTYYSLGNFVSNQTWEATDGGMVATLHFSQTDEEPLQITPSCDFVWVHKCRNQGRLRYQILPLDSAITLVKDSSAYRMRRFERLSRKFSTADTVIINK